MDHDPRNAVHHDDRPWGWFKQLAFNETCTVKVIRVEAGQALSLQYHDHRDELWMVLDDGLEIQLDGESHIASDGDLFFIRRGTTHRVVAHDTPGRFVEVAFGEFDEDDIVRLEDRYDRLGPPDGS